MSRAIRPQPSRSRKWLPRGLIVLAVLAVAGTGAGYWHRHKAAGAEGAWRTTAVERGGIRVAISSTGTLSAISTVTVGSQISGQVLQVLVDYNDQVTEGQVLARIDPKTYEAQIEQGNAQVASARAGLNQALATQRNAELDYRRKAELAERQLVARSDVDLARAALDQANAQVASAQAQIRQQTASTQTTQVNLDRTVIRSPVDGVVLTRSIEPGQTVAASLQAPELFTIAEDLSQMKIELAVDEADIGQVQPGQTVTFTADAFPDRQFRGQVQQVRLAATTTNNVVTYPVVVNVDNSDGTLLPGLTVNAEIEVSRRDEVLKVSNAALRYKPAGGVAVGGLGPPAAPAAAAAGRTPGEGLADDLSRAAAELKLDAAQQARFDQALAALRQRQEERRTRSQGGGSGPPGMAAMGGGANVESQMRQRMAARMKEDFADFRESLDPAQRPRWDAALAALVNARRSTLYRLVDGRPQPVTVRIGASDGSSTEVSGGGLKEGDAIVTGERAR
ncbi:efflux transporter periplasmic adaptor subunit [Pseudoxanthomonas broegbernensis]|uniref:Efflux transporter periplasmic adaptor subunit n=1 Tax=Pseudoxanthomonas broegbernensis TaxID=83619 RepID=A0A7V8GKH7_9GAMM|nr:efflux RND transporter periplasmic adaptor subunit [Pseudoxanthomonas broegbernensis]KAF1685030.1 efflux transporter periplasmic adaptor subunit [Pseudoxanthomonas broegbernensis]MBB6066370.1 HlyD family secretion protein [Pseudoxanthomonas broegbernensis]